MKERLELVKSFAELRTGMIVVTKNCLWCCGEHRAILGQRMVMRGHCHDGGISEPQAGFEMLPKPSCATRRFMRIVAAAVERRVVFRVVDGLESSQTTERVKELAR